MTEKELKKRLKDFALSIVQFTKKLDFDVPNKIFTGQIIRSVTSSAANYRAACRGKSTPDFLNKLKIVEEELDETLFFIELLAETNPSKKVILREYFKEGNELTSIIVSSIKTARSNQIKNQKGG